MSDDTRKRHFADTAVETELGTTAAEGVGIGGAIGGAVGAIAAAVAAVAAVGTSIAIPGLGLVIAGPLAAAAAAAGAGAGAGAGAAAASGGLIATLIVRISANVTGHFGHRDRRR